MQTCGCFPIEDRGQKDLASEVTYIGGDTGDDHLLLPSGFDGSTEVSVIPGIDLIVPVDNGDIGIHVCDLARERTVRA